MLCLCLLTLLAVLALPMQTSAHTNTVRAEIVVNPRDDDYFSETPRHESVPPIPIADIIRWIRVYKNPKRIPVRELTVAGSAAFSLPELGSGAPIYDFAEQGIKSVRFSYLQPFYDGKLAPVDYWTPFDGDTGELFEDPDDPDNSGLVTATDNTSVGIDDIVAIAVNITSWGGSCNSDMAIGPTIRPPYTGRQGNTEFPATRDEGKWRLNPHMPMWAGRDIGGNRYSQKWNPVTETLETHTLVYQFRVEPQHLELNTEGTWIKQLFVTKTENIKHRIVDDTGIFGVLDQYQTVDWIWGEAFGVRPTPTTVSPFNTFPKDARFLADWGGHRTNGLIFGGWQVVHKASGMESSDPKWIRQQVVGNSHRHVPMFDPANPPDPETGGPIYYPKIEAPGSRATTTMDVPSGTQTGAFTVTLHFRDGTVFEGHNFSDAGVDAFKDRLASALSAAGWTVTSLTVPEVPAIASSGVEGPTAPSASTVYKLVLSPRLGVKDAFALQIPENIVMDAGENGNMPSESVTVSVDTELKLAAGKTVEIPAPESGVYLAGNVIEVLVPFAQDGLTYAGEAPPYLTIYLGEAARHATWQQGEESAGSTLVPFKYVIDRADPIAESVRVGDEGLSIPTGTTLMNGAGLSRVGSDPMPMGSGKAPESSPPKPLAERLQILTSAGAPLPAAQTEKSVTVLPTPPVYLPPDDSEPKAGMSSVPRSPIVFNELGNGSGDTNDWLELRNVTGDAVSLKDWELSVVQDGKKEDTSLVVFPDVSVPAEGLLLLTNSDPTAEGNLLSGGDDIDTAKAEVKGSSHLYLVNAGLSLPDDGKFLLILRKAKEKRGLNEAFVDVAGGGGSGTDAFVREQEGDYDTYVWPLQVLEAPGDATEDALSSGKVWLRAKADIVGYHRDAWAGAAFTGVGYDRKVSKSAETAGTPGYPNGAVKTEAATPRGAITISEVMFDSAGGTLPQWVELYNASKTDALNLNRWELEIQNVDSEDLVGRPIVRLTLQEKVIQPNQTLLIVTGNARASSADVYPADRVYNLLELHDKNLRIKKPSDTFLSAKGFYLRLTDRNEHLVDEIGNTDGNRRTDDNPAWALPVPLSEVEGMRSSLVRRYDKGVARDGKEKSSWALAANFAKFKAAELHYGHADDIGTPGYRQGGALPVELSSFTVTRVESGSVIVTWTTESEVDNAGFNLRRSLTRDSGFTLLNPVLIAGAGTTGERQTYTFIDTSAKPGVEHYYQIEEVSFGGQAETLVTRRLRGPVSPAHRALKTLGEVKQAK